MLELFKQCYRRTNSRDFIWTHGVFFRSLAFVIAFVVCGESMYFIHWSHFLITGFNFSLSNWMHLLPNQTCIPNWTHVPDQTRLLNQTYLPIRRCLLNQMAPPDLDAPSPELDIPPCPEAHVLKHKSCYQPHWVKKASNLGCHNHL